ncbi:DUF397 domain-containing protein [Actinoalloteichus sp. AHMU CJ021]|uniref:DUF397 domain-containing protein n=2 Tax=Actinoalloteichus cyanogriseus TaxID=2893586 RepID=A0ABT1JCG4_ACTCY|nr:DUF397 domain-containing protein [Actinoalloteichus caeruleus]AUS80508.1 DUF397 domain-containing protein [Actinoalloteichus sp. AHMU CJ021]MCP2329863.1 protein of unknown function (DUF397) [Actinoalloteichus caeruleus DSM 43889]
MGIKTWRKSSRSGDSGQCVEVGRAADLAAVRDTKNRDGGMLVVDRDTFAAFLSAVKSGRL